MTFTEWLGKARVPFPAVNADNCRPTSPPDESCNCIAWAAEEDERWWWPDRQKQDYWPPHAPRTETLDAFVSAYASLGYVKETDSSVELGKQKIAIFVNENQTPTHASPKHLEEQKKEMLAAE